VLHDLEGEVKVPELVLGVEKYRVLGVLGEGGMGKVYLAHDRDLSRKVALKVMKSEGSAGAARFLDEAKVLAQLGHPNIVPVYEVGLTEEKRL
jgi:serine/threonine-protein kinase